MINAELMNKTKDSRFNIYYEYLVEQNQLLNLTAITEKEDVYLKHFYDSIQITEYFDFSNQLVLDIGAGAGFPSVPIYILNPSMKLSIVDGLNKRIDFLKRLSDKIELKIDLIHGRAEELNRLNYFDFVLARAVAKLNILVEMALPILKLNGYFIAYKSINYQEELEEALEGIVFLGGQVEKVIEYDLSEGLKHVYVVIKKVKPSPKGYPRIYSKIKKSPL